MATIPELPDLVERRAGRPMTTMRQLTPFTVFSVLVGVLIAALVLYPIARMIIDLFVTDWSVDLSAFRSAAEIPGLWRTLLNTILIIGASGTLALVLGSIFAWLNERTDARMGWISDVLPIVPLLVPGIAISIGWVFLLSPRAGVLNATFRSIFNVDNPEGPLNIFTWYGMIFIYTMELLPFAYVVVSASLRNINPALEEASRTAGSGPFATLWRVTLPATKPALASAALLLCVMGFAIFSVPSIIGSTAEIDVLSVQIVHLLNGTYPPRTNEAVVLGFFMLVVIMSVWALQRRILNKGNFSMVGGKGVRPTLVELGARRWIARLGIAVYVACATILPIMGLLLVSLQSYWTSTINLGNFHFRSFKAIFTENDQTREAITNSTILAASGATLGMSICLVLALYIRQRPSSLNQALDGIMKLPGTLSHIVVALGLLIVLAASPFNLGGTALLLLIGYVVIYLPQGSIAASSAASQIGDELTEASRVSGAGEGRTLRRISLPLMLPGLAAGWALLFVVMVGDLTASAILASPSSPVAGFVLLQLWQSGTYPLIAALALTMTLVSSSVVLTVLRLTRGKSAMGMSPN